MLTQETRQITLRFQYKESYNFDLLDKWLTSILKISIDESNNSTIHIESFINRNLLFINYLFQVILVPCFDKGSILEVKKDPRSLSVWSTTLKIANIDYIPDIGYKTILNFAIKNISWMIQNKITLENTNYIYDLIQSELVDKLKWMSGSGKSTIPILRVAHQKNIPFFHLGRGVYQFGWGTNARVINRSATDADSATGALISNNKKFTSDLIRMAGLPAPVNGVARDINTAEKIAGKIGWPVVVKPVDAERGEGVSIRIKNNTQLAVAFKLARQFSKSKHVIIEKEAQGVAHRVFIANGELLFVNKRLPISVSGDGVKNVSDLIKEANLLLEKNPPWFPTEWLPYDEEAIQAMKESGYTLTSVPKKGDFIPLRIIESTADGGTDKDLTSSIHPENIDIALRCAKLFNLNIVGIDMITTDIQKPWYETGAIINEVNFSPQIGCGDMSSSYIPTYLQRVINSEGRIPITVIVGGDNALKNAIKHQNKLIKKGISCFITSHNVSLNNFKKEITFTFQGIYKRCKVLLLNREVEELILVIQTDEILYTGLPIDKIKNITTINNHIVSMKNANKKLPENHVYAVAQSLEKYTKNVK